VQSHDDHLVKLTSNRSDSSSGDPPRVVRGRRPKQSLSPSSRARKPPAAPEPLTPQQAASERQAINSAGGAGRRGSSTAPAGAQPRSGEAAAEEEEEQEEGAQASRAGQASDPKAPLRARRRRVVNKDVKPDWAGAWE
jgi:hypothetical protein